MKYLRSRPWRSRGPWFSNRAGARRRGRRDDEVELVDSGTILHLHGDSYALNAGIQDVVVEDVLLQDAEIWSPPSGMLATRVDEDRILTLAPRVAAHDMSSRQINTFADAVIAAHVLSRQGEDDAGTSRSRQSA